ncbi:MAG TPA: hypothetical protein VIJ93_08720, partial [bacterium]
FAVSTNGKTSSKSVIPDNSMEMSVTKPKATSTFTATPTATPAEIEKIAYTTFEKNKPTLWTMNTDGLNRERLTAVGTSAFFPLWSPNGKILAFLSDMNEGNLNLFIVKKGEKDFQQLTFFPDMAFPNSNGLKPPFSWSPKSDELVYAYHQQVWKVELNNLSQITLAGFDNSYTIPVVEWAPHRDNKYVAVLVKKGINFFGLTLVNPRLKDVLKLVDSPKPISDIAWTPDARLIAYTLNNSAIYTASAETSIPKLLTSNASPHLGPLIAYKPVEESTPCLMVLAKQTVEEQGYRVALVDKISKDDKDSGTLKYLTESGVENAVWSPDGTKIAYLKAGELWIMDGQTGNNKTRIAATGILSPNWSKK